MIALGIDIGGSGIKAAPVSLIDGVLTQKRLRIDTPNPSKPEKVMDVVANLVADFGLSGPIGCTFPGIVRKGVTHSAANVDAEWIGFPAERAFTEKLGQPVYLLNDADAAGLAEQSFGAASKQEGTILMLTLGTGLGSALIRNGILVPNTEFGHLSMYGDSAERYMTDSARRREKLSWADWASRINEYFKITDLLLSPDLYILGGGVSNKYDKFLPLLNANAPIVPARLRNRAGIVGAAIYADDLKSNAT